MLPRRLIMPTKPTVVEELRKRSRLCYCTFPGTSNSPRLLQYMSLFLSVFFQNGWKWSTVTHAVHHFFPWHEGWYNQQADFEQETETALRALSLPHNPFQNLSNCPAGWQCWSGGITPQKCQTTAKHRETLSRILILSVKGYERFTANTTKILPLQVDKHHPRGQHLTGHLDPVCQQSQDFCALDLWVNCWQSHTAIFWTRSTGC